MRDYNLLTQAKPYKRPEQHFSMSRMEKYKSKLNYLLKLY